ncbi:hypothetical protein LTR56_011366 [Elasticomyces elasticus]|nr:hypothetical protein LTR56_011366 [Elasticomyces elasticus]KAK3660968.1 hypothetical protein LTR22_007796 [Elasticomyces elasticus]KAK4932375.1 hypothetical protein LTR49_001244 [Elasticomyces elasticus]KAK5768383.1 hypothetical protein LTS12_001522 [Elasticomyces elasticus]
MELSNMLNSTTPTNPSSPPHKREAPAHESPLSKRLKQDDALPDHQQTLQAAIAALDHETVRELLLDAAKASSAIHQATLAKSGGERSFPDSTGAISDIESLIGRLETQVKAESSYATKRSALEALCEIGEWIVNDGESDLGRSIREEMTEYENRSLVETMCYVVEIMTDEEKARLREERDVVGRISDLGGDGLDEALELGLDEVLELIEGQKDDQP